MKFLKMKKESRTYNRHTDHIFSADFALIKKELEAAGQVYQLDVASLPFIRMEIDSKRILLLNETESNKSYGDFKKLFCALDDLPTVLLNDLFKMYLPSRKNLFIRNYNGGSSEADKWRNTCFLLLPEVMWCHGNDLIKSRIFD